MYQDQIEESLTRIESSIIKEKQPQQILSLFYTTMRVIQKNPDFKDKNPFLKQQCFSLFNCNSQITNTFTKQCCKAQDLFAHFLQKNKKLSSQLDKVNLHMLKITAEMISDINQKKLNALYQSYPDDENSHKHVLNNKLQRTRSSSLFSRFEHLFSNNHSDLNDGSTPEQLSQHLNTQKTNNKLILQATPKANIKTSRLSQKTLESTSSQQNQVQNALSAVKKNISDGSNSSLEKVLVLFQQHKIDSAFQLLSSIQKKSPQLVEQYHNQNGKNNKLIKLKVQYEEMKEHYLNFDLTGYKLDKKQDDITLYYKIIQKQNLVAIQVQSQVDLNIQKFLCIASQIQLYDKYVPFNYQTLCLREDARNKKIGRSKVFIPLLNNRQAYFEAKAYDRLQKQNCIFIYSKNLKKQHLNELSIQYKSQGLIDLDYIFFLLSYTPIDRERGKIRMAICIDLKISILPKFILNKTARIFAFDYFKNMLNINKKFIGSPWQKAIQNKPEHYNFFREKINQYFQGKQKINK